jgi:hypothetical protein
VPFSPVVRQMPGYNSPRRGMARTVPITFFCCSRYCFFFCFVLFYVLFVFLSFCVLFVRKCVLYYCHRVSTQLHLTNISIFADEFLTRTTQITFTLTYFTCSPYYDFTFLCKEIPWQPSILKYIFIQNLRILHSMA